MTRSLVLVFVAACSGKSTAPTTVGSGSQVVTPPTSTARTCDDVKPRVEELYRAEAQSKEPKRVDDAVADNTAMAMNDCAKDPAKIVPCLANAASVADLEKQCLIPLSDDGAEGSK